MNKFGRQNKDNLAHYLNSNAFNEASEYHDTNFKMKQNSEIYFDEGSPTEKLSAGSREKEVSQFSIPRRFSKTASEATQGLRDAFMNGVGRGAKAYNKNSIELFTALVFIFILVGVVLMSVYLRSDVDSGVIDEGKRIILDSNFLNGTVEASETLRYSLSIPANRTVALTVTSPKDSEVLEVDATLEVKDLTGKTVAFSDDISTDNVRPLIFLPAHSSNVTYLVKVGTFEGAGSGKFSVGAYTVGEELTLGRAKTVKLPAGGVFATLIALEGGKVYHIYALGADTAIRVRDLEGNEIVQIFQSTLTEYQGHLLFSAPATASYIIEAREVQRPEVATIKVLVVEAETNELNLDTNMNGYDKIWFPLLSASSQVLQFTTIENYRYHFVFTIELNEEAMKDTTKDVLGPVFSNEENDFDYYDFAFVSSGIPEGVNIKMYNKVGGEIETRARTSFEATISDRVPMPEYLTYIDDRTIAEIAFVNLKPTTTTLDFEALEVDTILFDVTSFSPRYIWNSNLNAFDETQIGMFSIQIIADALEAADITKLAEQVDTNNLFPKCEETIDQSKYSLLSGCDRGVLLFCRNEFFPDRNPENATVRTFGDICDCVDFLCKTLPSGENITIGFRLFLNISYSVFAVISVSCFIVYLLSTLDLLVYGGFREWYHRGFVEWTFLGTFFLIASLFFVSEVILNREVQSLSLISDSFDATRIVASSDNLGYNYYDEILFTLVDYYSYKPVDKDGAKLFLNEEAIDAIPSGRTFHGLRTKVILNMIALVLMEAFAVISFLDVSVIWIESCRAATLNRKKRRNNFFRLKYSIRVLEFVYVVVLVVFSAQLLATNGESYSLVHSLFVLLFAIIIMLLYFTGRRGLRATLRVKSKAVALDPSIIAYWRIVRNVSTIVIAANLGCTIVQFYMLQQVRSFSDFAVANNDPTALSLLLFQYICIFSGQLAIFYYLGLMYLDFRTKLIEGTLFDTDQGEIPTEFNKTKMIAETTFVTGNSTGAIKVHKVQNPAFDSDINNVI